MRAECSPEEFSEGGAGASNRPQSRVYKILTQTRYTTVTKTNQVIDCDRFENTRKSHKDGHVGTTRTGSALSLGQSQEMGHHKNSKRSKRIRRLRLLQVLQNNAILKPCHQTAEVLA